MRSMLAAKGVQNRFIRRTQLRLFQEFGKTAPSTTAPPLYFRDHVAEGKTGDVLPERLQHAIHDGLTPCPRGVLFVRPVSRHRAGLRKLCSTGFGIGCGGWISNLDNGPMKRRYGSNRTTSTRDGFTARVRLQTLANRPHIARSPLWNERRPRAACQCRKDRFGEHYETTHRD